MFSLDLHNLCTRYITYTCIGQTIIGISPPSPPQAYNVGLITDSILQARHNLRLIATSEGCFLMPQNSSTSDANPAPTSTKQTPTAVSHSGSTDHTQHPWFQSSHEDIAAPHNSSFSPDSRDSEFLAVNPHQAVGAALLMAAAFTRSVENLSSAAQISHASSVVGQGSSRTQPAIMECAPAPPCAWFIADDEVTKVRYFVIQGSTNMEHWAINLHFQPVLFEDDKSGERDRQVLNCIWVRPLVVIINHVRINVTVPPKMIYISRRISEQVEHVMQSQLSNCRDV